MNPSKNGTENRKNLLLWRALRGGCLACALALAGSGCSPQSGKDQSGPGSSAAEKPSAGTVVTPPAGGAKPAAKPVELAKASAPAPAASEPFGVYTLVTVDGKKLPCTVTHEGQLTTIQSGTFDLRKDGTCVSKIAIQGEESTPEVKATYRMEGQAVKMRWEGVGITMGNLDGSQFTMNYMGMALGYRR